MSDGYSDAMKPSYWEAFFDSSVRRRNLRRRKKLMKEIRAYLLSAV